MGTSGVAAKAFRMRLRSLRLLVSGTVLTVAAGLAACSGNMGTGSLGGGLPVPAANGYQQPQGPSAASASRQRIVEGAVYVTSDLAAVPLPDVDGFSLALSLATSAPAASASPGPSATPTARSLRQKVSRVVVVAQAAAPSESAVTPIPAGSALPSAGPSVSPSAAPSPSPAAKPSASSKATARPSPTASGPKIDTKLVAYPDYAPDAPTPVPSGNVQTFAKRKPLVRGYVSPAVDLPLYGLAAARFTIPAAEQLPNRGYTVAIFTSVKKHKQQLVASDSSAALVGSVVASTLATPLTLKKGTGYDIVLYGDEGPSTPAPIASGYATPGTNPFVTPMPTGYPGQYGTPQNGFTTPYPGQTYGPPGYQTPTPYPTR